MVTLDTIAQRYVKRSIRSTNEMISRRWHMRQQFKSPSYTPN